MVDTSTYIALSTIEKKNKSTTIMSTNPSPAVPNKVISVIKKTYQQSDYRDQRYSVCIQVKEEKTTSDIALCFVRFAFWGEEMTIRILMLGGIMYWCR